MTAFADRLTAAVARVPTDMRAKVRARVRARPHELAALEREVDRRYGVGVAAAAARPAKRRANPRALKAELDAAVADGRILASRRAHYERLAAKDGEAKVATLLRSLAPGLDPATSATLFAADDRHDAPGSNEPWMRTRPGPGWIGAGPRPSRRITWDPDPVTASSGPDLNGPPFASSHPTPNLAPLGTPRANGHGGMPPGRSVPGLIIDGGPRR